MRKAVASLIRTAKRVEQLLTAALAIAVLNLLGLLPVGPAMRFADALARTAGPWLPRQRVAMANLRRAFPDMDEAEHLALSRDMWVAMARLATEYVFMEKLIGPVDPGRLPERIEVEGVDIFLKMRDEGGPHIIFTAHIGNFEVLPIVAAAYGLDVASLFRTPNNPYIARRLATARGARMGQLVPSGHGAALTLTRILENGGNVGMLVDQRFARGIEARFFGHPCDTNPLAAKLARRMDCPVHPARCIRLPDGRFRVEIFPALVPPRDGAGEIDVAAFTQMITGIVEDWVRQTPGQWQWFHKRWKRGLRNRKKPSVA